MTNLNDSTKFDLPAVHVNGSDRAGDPVVGFVKSEAADKSLLERGVTWDQLAGGRFEPRKLLGRGGFAMVYQAYDRRLRREVALKIPHITSVADQSAQQWLRREGLASASLQHPHLVHLYDFEVNGQNSFLVSELIEGQTLAEYIENHPAGCNPRVAAELVMLLAEALQHAHSKNVLHRDIKPSNILLDQRTRAGDLFFSPRLADFGLATAPTQESLTGATGGLMGSLHYLPPEIVSGSSSNYTVQSDIYALAVVLRELLTGERTTTGSNISQILIQISQGSFGTAVQNRAQVPRDLWAICVQAMDIHPHRRYASAQLMADDLRRYLQGRPVLARVPGVIERTWRWARRNPTLTTSMVLLGITITSVVSVVVVNNRRLSATLRDLQAAQNHNEQIIYAQDMAQATELLQTHDFRGIRSILARYSPDQPMHKHTDVDYRLLSKSIQKYTSKLLWTAPHSLYTASFTRFGRELFLAGAGSQIFELHPRTQSVHRQWDTGQDEINCLLLKNRRPLTLWSSGDDGTCCAWNVNQYELLWRTQVFDAPTEAHDIIYLEQLDRLVVLGSNDQLSFLSSEDGKLLTELPVPKGRQSALANLHDGRHFLYGNARSAICKVDGQTMQELLTLPLDTVKHPRDPNFAIRSISVSSDDRWAAVVTRNEVVYLIDLQNWSIVDSLDPQEQIRQIRFLDLPVGSARSEFQQLWFLAKSGIVYHLEISAEGRLFQRDSWATNGQRVFGTVQNPFTGEVVTLDGQGDVRTWSEENAAWKFFSGDVQKHWYSHFHLDLSRGFDTASPTRELFLFGLSKNGIEITSRTHPDKYLLDNLPAASLCDVGRSELWAVNQPTQAHTLSWQALMDIFETTELQETLTKVELPWQKRTLPFRADEMRDSSRHFRLVSSDAGQWVAGWDAQAKRVWCMRSNQTEIVKTSPVQELNFIWFEPNSQNCWWVSRHLEIYRWNLSDGSDPKLVIRLKNQPAMDLAISPDKSLLAIQHDDGSCLLWDLNRNEQLRELLHKEALRDVAFSASGRTLMLLGERGRLTCWNLDSGRMTFDQAFADKNNYGGFTSDSRYLIRSSEDNDGWTIEPLEAGSTEY